MRHVHALLVLLPLLAGGLGVPSAMGADPPAPATRRLLREISVMEKTIDEMLLDSPNLLVYAATNVARGHYIDDYGVVFTFGVSLVARAPESPEYRFKDFKIEDKGDQIIIRREKPGAPAGERETEASAKEKATALRARQAQQYAAGREEIVQFLLDYGSTLTLLRDTQRVTISAFLRDSDYFKEQHLSRLAVSLRMSDLRGAAAGRITRDELVKRVVVEEY